MRTDAHRGFLFAAALALIASAAACHRTEPAAPAAAAPEAAPAAAARSARAMMICLPDPVTGEIDTMPATRDPAGLLRGTGPGAPELKLDPRAEAQGADWYRNREPIVWNGKTYRPGGEWRETALRRYLRHQGLYRGVPLLSLWPGGDRTLAVLVEQESCTFRSYAPEGDE